MLALKYRPTTLDEVVGQRPVTAILKAMIARNAVPSSMVFTGPRGTGKTSTARILAQELLNAYGSDGADIIEIDAASHGGVDDVRDLRQTLFFSGARVVIFDEAHSMSREAFNALLKVMEEPPEHATFILVTTEPNRIPETILSRCISFDFKRLSAQDIYERLVYVVDTEDRPDVEPELLEFIALKADGGMRDALMLLDRALRANIYFVSEYEDLLGQLDVGPTLLSSSLESYAKGIKAFQDALQFLPASAVVDSLIDTMTDIIQLREGLHIQRSGSSLESRNDLVAKLKPGQILQIMQILWTLKKLERADSLNSSLKVAAVMICEALEAPIRDNGVASAPVEAPKAKKTTLSDLKNL